MNTQTAVGGSWLGMLALVILFSLMAVLILALVAQNRRRARAEAALRTREAQLSNAVKIARLGDWEYDVATDTFLFNDDFYAIFHTAAREAGGYTMRSQAYAERFLHPDDLSMVGDETRKAIETTDPNYSRQLEHRIRYADGGIGIIVVRIFIQKDAQGRTVKTYGVNQDITERRRAEDEVKKSLAEKETLLRELYHRTKNNMGVVNSMLALQAGYFEDGRMREAFAEAQDRIRSMSLVHEKLYEARDLSHINFRSYVADLMQLLIASLSIPPEKISYAYDTEDVFMPIDSAVACGIILNELLTNAMKHAFPGDRKGVIRVALRREPAGAITIRVSDDGRGLPPGFDPRRDGRMGLQTIFSLAERQLGGWVEIESGPGFDCTFRFFDGPYKIAG